MIMRRLKSLESKQLDVQRIAIVVKIFLAAIILVFGPSVFGSTIMRKLKSLKSKQLDVQRIAIVVKIFLAAIILVFGPSVFGSMIMRRLKSLEGNVAGVIAFTGMEAITHSVVQFRTKQLARIIP